MRQPLPTRKLRPHPDLDQLKRQAKELLKAFVGGDESVAKEVRAFHPAPSRDAFALHDAQLVLARSYGYETWPKLKAYVDGVTVGRLIERVRTGDFDAVRDILTVRPELVNVPIYDGYPALQTAVLARATGMVRLLMERGADPHAGIYPHIDATSAISIATDRGYDEIVRALQEGERRREQGRPTIDEIPASLRSAIAGGDEDATIRILHEHPALARFQLPGNRWTLLHVAAAGLMQRLARWLLDLGADVSARAADDSTAIDVAGTRFYGAGKSQRMRELVAELRNRGVPYGPRAAVTLGDTAALREWQAQDKLAPPQDDRGWLLRLAVDADRLDLVAFLLDLGLDPDARARVGGVDEIEFTWGMPLYECVRAHKHEMARLLLERGADANGQVYASGTPLSEAYGQRDSEMIALLERHGGAPNPSMAGLYRRKDLAVRLLEAYGSDPLPDDGFGSGPVAEQLVAAAAKGGDVEILALALQRVDWPKGDPRWYGALIGPLGFWNHWVGPWCHLEWDRTTYLQCFKMLLERSGPPVAPLRYGVTLLHEVVTMRGHVTDDERVAFAIAALDAGAPTGLRDDTLLSTPLGWASRWGREDLVSLFLERGADPVERDAEPWATPLAWAEKKSHARIVSLLRHAASSGR